MIRIIFLFRLDKVGRRCYNMPQAGDIPEYKNGLKAYVKECAYVERNGNQRKRRETATSKGKRAKRQDSRY